MLDYQAQLAAQKLTPVAPAPVTPPPPPAPPPMPSSVSAPLDIAPLPAPPPPAPIPPNPASRNTLRAGLDFLRNRARGAQLPPEKAGADDEQR
ncbi:MAG: hypothetical protein V9G20_30205 [Candidatus Promineifilaceae bacterium]